MIRQGLAIGSRLLGESVGSSRKPHRLLFPFAAVGQRFGTPLAGARRTRGNKRRHVLCWQPETATSCTKTTPTPLGLNRPFSCAIDISTPEDSRSSSSCLARSLFHTKRSFSLLAPLFKAWRAEMSDRHQVRTGLT